MLKRLWPVSFCQQLLLVSLHFAGRWALWHLSKLFYAKCLATSCGVLLPCWGTFIAAFAVNWHHQSHTGKDFTMTVEGLQGSFGFGYFFSPNTFQLVSICCQSNKTRWAKQINTFIELGKWQMLCSFYYFDTGSWLTCFNANSSFSVH